MKEFDQKKVDLEGAPEALKLLLADVQMLAWGIIKGLKAARTVAEAATKKTA